MHIIANFRYQIHAEVGIVQVFGISFKDFDSEEFQFGPVNP